MNNEVLIVRVYLWCMMLQYMKQVGSSSNPFLNFSLLGVEQLCFQEERRGILSVMASEREVFELSGPLHLAPVDW